MTCPRCYKGELQPIAGDFPTGVVAPDGYRETWYQEGLQCDKCGTIVEKDDEVFDPLPVTFTDIEGEDFYLA